MPAQTGVPGAQRYLAKRALGPRRIRRRPSPRLGLVVVIPSRDEPELLRTLDSLRACTLPECDVEVLVVVNASDNDEQSVKDRNRASLHASRRWAAKVPDSRLTFRFLNYPNLPGHEAGVGLARKLGMDEAVARLDCAGAGDGIVASLDADCVCDSNYLQALYTHFRDNPATPGCSVYFEHPLCGPLDSRLYDGIASYELYLRYYVHGLRFASLPFAYHTVGSSMAVRASAYVAQGGMNRRQAGEDFYFLQKFIAIGGFSELQTTRVIPSPRPSHRAPFGTGRAMQRWLEDSSLVLMVDSPKIFRELALFAQCLEHFCDAGPEDPELLSPLPAMLSGYLEQNRFRSELARVQRHTASRETFRQQLFCWFNAFRALKYVHLASDERYPKVPITSAAAQLLQWSGHGEWPAQTTICELLAYYRDIDRGKITKGRVRDSESINSTKACIGPLPV